MTHSRIHITCTMPLCSKYVKINEILYAINVRRSMDKGTISSMSHRLSFELGSVIEFHTLYGPKKFLFFLPMKYLSDKFRKNIYCNFKCEHNIDKK